MRWLSVGLGSQGERAKMGFSIAVLSPSAHIATATSDTIFAVPF